MQELTTALRFRWLRLRLLTGRALLSLRRRGLKPTLRRVLEVLGLRSTAPDTGHLLLPGPVDPEALRLPTSETPVASIVVPVHGKLALSLVCLRAVADAGGETPFELILVDDGSTDDTPRVMPRIPGLRYQRTPRNLGFIGACRQGAAAARGEYLVFLNNDTAVQPGWLDALLATFRTHPDTGIAGARLLYPDGRLQEAGGVIYRDGGTGNVGRFEPPDHPAFCHVREVDYCSGAALAIARTLYEAVGGFDTTYGPAYYEDADLAMKVRAAGHKVRYQPASVVVHFEGGSSGTDPLQGVKAYQTANRAKFLARWRDTLTGHPAPDTADETALRRHAPVRVLIVDTDTPTPDRDSGSLRLVNLMRLLVEAGCSPHFLPETGRHAGAYTTALQALGVACWHQPWIGETTRWFRRHGRDFDLVIASRHYVAASYLSLARQFAPQARFVFDTVDLHFLREQREAEVRDDRRLAQAAEDTRKRELDLIHRADLTLVVSPAERALLAELAPEAEVAVLSNVHALPETVPGRVGRRDLLFVGGFRHPPNVDAARWLVEAVLPLLQARLPDLQCHLVGGEVPPEIAALAARPGVQVHGHVPDLQPLLDGALVSVAPLRYGAGVKGKVNQAMAHGLPVVATACAVEGMHLRDGQDVLVADAPADFAEAVLRLHADAALWERLARNGRDNVRTHFSFDAARRAVERLLSGLRQDRRA